METLLKSKENVQTIWRCPSNIAIVKYWGKKGRQIPCNTSLSMTLSNSYTQVAVELSEKKSEEQIQLSYFFDDKLNPSFGNRVQQFLKENQSFFPFSKDKAITIRSFNSFPHSAGIASSASSFGAISLALLDLTYSLNGNTLTEEFYQKASNLARLGSGSASRSLFPGYALWGENSFVANSSDEYAIKVEEIHPVFQEMQDAIIIVEDAPKKVSSSVGHQLMENHPFAEARFQQANANVLQLLDILKRGDMDAFIHICESEALTLHAMMMTSSDYYLLMKPQTIAVIEKIIAYRKESKIPLCFTLDAGPNVHLLYPKSFEKQVKNFIENDLAESYKQVIYDEIGEGPKKHTI